MKVLKYATGVVYILGLIGCTNTPDMSKGSVHKVTLANGKQYMVPINANYTREPVTEKVVKFYKSVGVTTCKSGDITWENKTVADTINDIMRNGNKNEGIIVYKKAANEGMIGCVSAMK